MNRNIRIVLISFAIFAGYVVWILMPHLSEVEITNNAGLNEAEVELIVSHLKSKKAFSGKGGIVTILSSAIDPTSRPHYFVEIDGDSTDIIITAGYIRGELWGGGPVIRAKKIDGKWQFEKNRSMLWTS